MISRVTGTGGAPGRSDHSDEVTRSRGLMPSGTATRMVASGSAGRPGASEETAPRTETLVKGVPSTRSVSNVVWPGTYSKLAPCADWVTARTLSAAGAAPAGEAPRTSAVARSVPVAAFIKESLAWMGRVPRAGRRIG